MRAPSRMSVAWKGGFTRLELLVVGVVFAVAAGIMLERLHAYQEAAERADMEYVISAVKSGLRIRIARMLLQGQTRDLQALAADNPIDWLDVKPANYGGELAAVGEKYGKPGKWYYDRDRRHLVYLVRTGSRFQPDSEGLKRVRLVVRLRFPDQDQVALGTVDNTVSVTVVPVEPYRW